jgi:ribonucleoside-diphosphate reductase alpha chain
MGEAVQAFTAGPDIDMQPASQDIWDKKYRLKDRAGNPVDNEILDTFKRIARSLADAEAEGHKRDQWYQRFVWALQNGALPAGRIISNAGAQDYKPATSTINCTVSGTIVDSMDDILNKNHEAGMTLKAGCGIGYEFSTLRPKGAYVSGAGAHTSGPLSFMDIYDSMCFTVSSAGGRRGAQMATFDVNHPDVLDFIRAKREDGRLRQFNLSLLITSEFIQAVKKDEPWHLSFPITEREVNESNIDLTDRENVLWRPFPVSEGYVSNEHGEVACRIYKTLPATAPLGHDHVLHLRLRRARVHSHRQGQRDEQQLVAREHPRYQSLRRTAPAPLRLLPARLREPDQARAGSVHGEGALRLGALPRGRRRVHAHARQRGRDQRPAAAGAAHEINYKRRHGMGFLGLGSTLTMLGMRYGDDDSVAFTERVAREMALAGWEQSLELAREKGPAPIMDDEFVVTPEMLDQRPEMARDGIQVGDKVPGRVLHARYSRYMQRVAEVAPQLVDKLAAEGGRFTHHTSIAPTGTISLSLGNNASNGIEPSFAHHYSRNIIREGRKTKEKVDVFSYELLAYRQLVNHRAMPFSERSPGAAAGLLQRRR